jgi:hypothetical protein
MELKDRIWPQATFLSCEAALGYRHGPGDAGAGRGGVCMWVASQVSHLIRSSENSQCNRTQWVRF